MDVFLVSLNAERKKSSDEIQRLAPIGKFSFLCCQPVGSLRVRRLARDMDQL